MKTLPIIYRTLMTMLMVSGMLILNVDAFGQCSECETTCTAGAGATGDCAFAACEGSSASGDASAALSGGSASDFKATALSAGDASASHAFAVGHHANAQGDYSVAIGRDVFTSSTSERNFILGVGNPSLTNSISNSLMIGFNSNVSTVFVDNSGGTTGSYGNVGIGDITNPSSLLHVRDQLRVGYDSEDNGSIVFNNSTNSNTITFKSGVSTADQLYTLPLAEGVDGDILTYTTGGQLEWTNGGTATDDWRLAGNNDATANSKLGTLNTQPLMIYANNLERMRVITDGNVGIGTTVPDRLLHLKDGSGEDTYMLIEKEGTTQGGILWHNGAQSAGTINAGIILNDAEDLYFENRINDEDLIFRAKNGTSLTEVMRIKGTNSRVGIGVISPAQKLHVRKEAATGTAETIAQFDVSDADSGEYLRIGNGVSGDGVICPMVLGRNDNTTAPPLLLYGEIADNGTTTIPAMRFEVNFSGNTVDNRPSFEWRNAGTARMTMDADGNLGIGTASPTEILHINGIGRSDDDFWTTTSDERLKENIEELEGARNILTALNPVTYNWVDTYYNAHPSLSSNNWGFIAQEVEQVMPEMVTTVPEENVGDSINEMVLTDLKLLNLSPLLPILVKGYQELDNVVTAQNGAIDGMQQQIDSLLSIVATCCQSIEPSFRMENNEDPDLLPRAEAKYILFQNDPNPFQYSTQIRYHIPTEITEAEILILDANGRVVKRIPLSLRDADGSLTVYSSDLNSGIYSYSLIGNGRVLESKKMVCSK